MIQFKKGYGKSLLPLTNKFYDRTAGTISNITGLVNAHELSIIEMKTLDNLMHTSLGIWNSATPENPSTVDAGGTAVFRVQQLLQFNKYTSANRDDKGQLPKSEVKVKIPISHSESCRYELETLDLPGLGFGTREQFVSYVAAGMQKSLTALMDAHYIDVFVQDLKAKITAWKAANSGKSFADYVATTNQVIYNEHWDKLETGATDELTRKFKINTAYLQASDARIDLSRTLTRYDLGAQADKFATFLYQKITNRFLNAMDKSGDSATNISKELTETLGASVIAGLGLVKDHLYFGQNIPKGTSFSADTDFDFSKVYGITAHAESAFVAVQGMTTSGVILPHSHNQEYVMKFNLFKGMVRDALYALFLTGDITA